MAHARVALVEVGHMSAALHSDWAWTAMDIHGLSIPGPCLRGLMSLGGLLGFMRELETSLGWVALIHMD